MMILLFFPVFCMLAADLVYLSSTHETKITILKYIYNSEVSPTNDKLFLNIVFLFPYISNAICFALILLKLIPARETAKAPKIINVSIMHIATSIAITIMLFFAYLLRSMTILKYSFVALSLSTIGGFFINQRYPEYLQLVIVKTVRNGYVRSTLSGIDSESISRHLIELMENEKMFADEDLSLKRMAYELSISPHQLSQLLNEKLHSNFNSFVNRYRVDEAKKMLVEEPNRSLMSICSGVGFNTKSSFYRAFLRSTGMTPCNYRKMSQGENQETAGMVIP